MPDRDAGEVAAARVRRLEVLRWAGIVQREAEGFWSILCDLTERGRWYDVQRLVCGVAVKLKSHLLISTQTCPNEDADKKLDYQEVVHIFLRRQNPSS